MSRFVKKSFYLIAFLATTQVFGAIEANRRRADIEVEKRTLKKGGGSKGPQLNKSAVFAFEVEQKLVKGIDKTLRYLAKTAARIPKKSKQRLSVLENIHNLHLEQAVYVRNQEERAYDKRWTAWDANNRRGKEPQLNTTKSNDEWKSVIKSASDIMKEYPRSQNADKILFNEAQALQYLKKERDAAKKYTDLITTYPNSAVSGDAYSALGDYYYDRNDFNTAMNNYKQALKFKNSSRFLWSVFKLGWCSFNLGKYRESLQYWQSVVKLSPRYKDKGGGSLKDEALKDMAFAFTELMMVDPAIKYYASNGGNAYIGDLLKLLSSEFADKGRYKEAIATLRKFQAREPLHQEAPNMQKDLIQLAYEMGDMKTVWRELARFPKLYGPKSKWSQKYSANKQLLLENAKMIQDQFTYYSKITHARAIETSSIGLHKEARIGYLLYMQTYPRSSDAVEVLFNLSDIEYFLKNYQRSAWYSLKIVKLGKEKAVIAGKNGKPVNIHATVSKQMLQAYAKDFNPEFKKLEADIKKRGGKPDYKNPQKLSKRATNYLSACAEYRKHYPKDPPKAPVSERYVETCEVDAAKIFFYLGNKNKSRDLLKVIALKYPHREEGKNSVFQIIPMYADNNKELLVLVDKFLQIPKYARDKDLGPELNRIKQAAKIDDATNEKDDLKRAKKLEDLAKANPKATNADDLYFNASVAYLKAGSIPDVLRIYGIIFKAYPNYKLAPQLLLDTATIYENLLDFKTAAIYYEAYFKKYKKDKKAPAAFQKSCELRLALETADAVSTCTNFAATYKNLGQPYIEALIDYAERKKNSQLMVSLINDKYLRAYKLDANSIIIAEYRVYKAAGKRGAAANNAVKNILATFQRNRSSVAGEALEYVGELYFRQADASVYNKYMQMKFIGGNFDRLDKSINAKVGALAAYKKAYDEVLATKDPFWGVAALVRLGEGYEHLFNMYANPPAIKENSLEEVKKALMPKAVEFRQATAVSYKQAFDSVSEFKIYNEWSKRAYNHHMEMSGSDSRIDEEFYDPDFVTSRINPTVISQVK